MPDPLTLVFGLATAGTSVMADGAGKTLAQALAGGVFGNLAHGDTLELRRQLAERLRQG